MGELSQDKCAVTVSSCAGRAIKLQIVVTMGGGLLVALLGTKVGR